MSDKTACNDDEMKEDVSVAELIVTMSRDSGHIVIQPYKAIYNTLTDFDMGRGLITLGIKFLHRADPDGELWADALAQFTRQVGREWELHAGQADTTPNEDKTAAEAKKEKAK